ncbi:MAG: hypothetical protein U5L46_04405 [Agrobacterium sp.]|nr:hypothetical protein [Agrobacterium sp.]
MHVFARWTKPQAACDAAAMHGGGRSPAGKVEGSASAEIDNEAERQEIVCAADVQVMDMSRRRQASLGGQQVLIEWRMRGHAWTGEHDGLHVFVACEKSEARAANFRPH